MIIFIVAFSINSCASCRQEAEPEVSISASPLTLIMKEQVAQIKPAKEVSKIKRIDIGPRKEPKEDLQDGAITINESVVGRSEVTELPPDTIEETDMTARLRQKMSDAYGEKSDEIPDVKIYLSEMKYDDFVSYYQSLGYKVQKVAIPAMQVIEPVLEQKPELRSKLDLSKYEGTMIHQVMIDDAGISAADRYIDPDTYEIVEKTFVTKMAK